MQDFFRPITGLPISTYFSSYKLKWLIDNVPAVQKALHARQAYVGKAPLQLQINSAKVVH